jgi:hypothetical protein
MSLRASAIDRHHRRRLALPCPLSHATLKPQLAPPGQRNIAAPADVTSSVWPLFMAEAACAIAGSHLVIKAHTAVAAFLLKHTHPNPFRWPTRALRRP